MDTIALFGGSFDPPHIGHEAIVKEIEKLKILEKVVIMPTYLNPFKSKFYAPSSLRLKWLNNIFASYENVEVDSYEINLQRKVPSIETVKYLLKTYKNIYLVIGADNLESLSKWYKYDELKTLVTFVVAQRDNIDVPANFIKLNVEENISSTSLRENIDKNRLSDICSDEITKFYKEKNDK
ncbi:MAG: nicotinate (nicotinamide) nucleotide adenylyltransferase [Campylobacterota bacterium]|nr:nicotinate (nicotinamide) nucleotide adenylyltransferase [Campylobacterota bacterium]